MQTATGNKRFDFGQVKVAALALGAAGILTAGVAAVTLTRDDSSTVSRSDPRPITWAHPDEIYGSSQEMTMGSEFNGIDGATDAAPVSAGSIADLPQEAVDALLALERQRAGTTYALPEEAVDALLAEDALNSLPAVEQPWDDIVSGPGDGIVGDETPNAVRLVPPYADRLTPTY
jgi:hypothetical protein